MFVNRDDPESVFALSRDALRRADVRFCQLEAIYVAEGEGVPNPTWRGAARGHRTDPRNATALKSAGFDVVSMAGNHCLDWGYDGLFKTRAIVEQGGAAVIGVGKNLGEARKPAIIERHGVRLAFLAYNSILPTNYWATEDRPGCAPIRGFTVYDPYEYDQPGQPARVHTFCHRGDLALMAEDIRKARAEADAVVASLHYGLHLVPSKLADYQKEASYAAIDAGADLVLGHHAHIMKGIEVHRGKVIFYGLGNFVFDGGMRNWPNVSPFHRELVEMYHLESQLEPEWMKFYGFPRDSRNTIIVNAVVSKQGVVRVSFLPALINKLGQPEVLGRDDERRSGVIKYVEWLCQDQGLAARFSLDGDEVVVSG